MQIITHLSEIETASVRCELGEQHRNAAHAIAETALPHWGQEVMCRTSVQVMHMHTLTFYLFTA